MNTHALHIETFTEATDLDTQRKILQLYDGTFPIAPILHQALTGVAGMTFHLAWLDEKRLAGAGILKSSEAVMPVGPDVRPIAWAVSDMVTHPTFRRHGIGRAILKSMESTALRNGGRVIYLYADAENRPAIALYSSVGYQRMKNQSGQAIFVKLLGEPYGAN